MKHEDVVAALKAIADKETATAISSEDLTDLRLYKLIEITKGEENSKKPSFSLTKKGRVMLKSNLKA